LSSVSSKKALPALRTASSDDDRFFSLLGQFFPVVGVDVVRCDFEYVEPDAGDLLDVIAELCVPLVLPKRVVDTVLHCVAPFHQTTK